MVDFVKLLRDDFINGTVVFVGSREDAADIEETLFAHDFTRRHLVFKTHPISHYIFIAYGEAHPDWNGEEMRSETLRDNLVIPWETTARMVNSLSNDTVPEIIGRFLRSEAYININATDEDITDTIDMLAHIIDDEGIDAGIHDDVEFTGRTYIEYLYDDHYRSLFVDTNMGRELNASNACGVGTESSAITPSLVYPIAYIAKKLSSEEHNEAYTEEDFDEIFN